MSEVLPHVFLGHSQKKAINWRDPKFLDDSADDDDELPVTPSDVVDALGFDPLEFNNEGAKAMPLEQGSSKAAFEHNVKAEIAAGKPQKQAVAIAYSQAGEKRTGDCGAAAGTMFKTPDGLILFVRRAPGSDHEGEWAFPGGMVEAGESLDFAAARENREELGMNPPGARQAVDETAAAAGPAIRFHTFRADVPRQFTPKLNSEHTAYTWAQREAAPKPLHPGVAATLSKLTGLTNDGPAWDEAKHKREATGQFSTTGAGSGNMEHHATMSTKHALAHQETGEMAHKAASLAHAGAAAALGRANAAKQDMHAAIHLNTANKHLAAANASGAALGEGKPGATAPMSRKRTTRPGKLTESDILHETPDFSVRGAGSRGFEVYSTGLTHSTKVASVGPESDGKYGLKGAIAEAEKRQKALDAGPRDLSKHLPADTPKPGAKPAPTALTPGGKADLSSKWANMVAANKKRAAERAAAKGAGGSNTMTTKQQDNYNASLAPSKQKFTNVATFKGAKGSFQGEPATYTGQTTFVGNIRMYEVETASGTKLSRDPPAPGNAQGATETAPGATKPGGAAATPKLGTSAAPAAKNPLSGSTKSEATKLREKVQARENAQKRADAGEPAKKTTAMASKPKFMTGAEMKAAGAGTQHGVGSAAHLTVAKPAASTNPVTPQVPALPGMTPLGAKPAVAATAQRMAAETMAKGKLTPPSAAKPGSVPTAEPAVNAPMSWEPGSHVKFHQEGHPLHGQTYRVAPGDTRYPGMVMGQIPGTHYVHALVPHSLKAHDYDPAKEPGGLAFGGLTPEERVANERKAGAVRGAHVAGAATAKHVHVSPKAGEHVDVGKLLERGAAKLNETNRDLEDR